MTQRKTRPEIPFAEFRTRYWDELTTSDRQVALDHPHTVPHRRLCTPLTANVVVLAELLQQTR